MKNTIKIISIIAIIAFGFTACGSGANCDPDANNTSCSDQQHIWHNWTASEVWGIQTRSCQCGELTGMRLAPDMIVKIPAGNFLMGSPANEPLRGAGGFGTPNEGPQRMVTISSAFYMFTHPVTQDQWHMVMGSNPSWFHGGEGREPAENEVQGKRPVENITWYDVLVFANKLSNIEEFTPAYEIVTEDTWNLPENERVWSTNPEDWGTVPTTFNARWNAVREVAGSTGYRMPTEAQWEYAARAGTTTAFSNGNNFNDENSPTGYDPVMVGEVAWFNTNSDARTREVGQLKPNPWGLYDMHGNVWEWVWDWLGNYPAEAQEDPRGAPTGTFRIGRGGSWWNEIQNSRSATRGQGNPNVRDSSLGIRLVRP